MKRLTLLFCTVFATHYCNAHKLFDPHNHPRIKAVKDRYYTPKSQPSKNLATYFDDCAISSILKRTHTTPININAPSKAGIAYLLPT